MDSERFKRIDSLLHAALGRPAAEREAFLRQECAGDEELEREVRSLLASDREAGSFLDHPVVAQPAEPLEGSTVNGPAWEGMHSGSLPQPAIGSQLGPYRIEAPLGSGGMGKVYRALDTRLRRTVAIKIPNEPFDGRFEREARSIAALNHPNICTVYDVGPNYLVMELVEGFTLAERIGNGPVPLEEALAISRQIAAALETAHERGIIHRDLKPANIKIKPDGTVKVLDFGLARTAPDARSRNEEEGTRTLTVTDEGRLAGTPSYMAPEQALGQAVDKRADIWAFGVVVYEMLTGRRLFKAATVSDTLAAVLGQEPDWAQVPPQARRLLQRCLERDLKRRLRDIGDAMPLLEEGPATAIPAKKSRLPWAVAIAVAGALAVALAVAGVGWWRAALPVEQPLTRLSVDLDRTRCWVSISRLPSRRTAADWSFRREGRTANSSLPHGCWSRPQATLLPDTENGRDPFFSPDSQWVGFFADGKLKKLSVQGGAPVTAMRCHVRFRRQLGGRWNDCRGAEPDTPASRRVPAAGGRRSRLPDWAKAR